MYTFSLAIRWLYQTRLANEITTSTNPRIKYLFLKMMTNSVNKNLWITLIYFCLQQQKIK